MQGILRGEAAAVAILILAQHQRACVPAPPLMFTASCTVFLARTFFISLNILMTSSAEPVLSQNRRQQFRCAGIERATLNVQLDVLDSRR